MFLIILLFNSLYLHAQSSGLVLPMMHEPGSGHSKLPLATLRVAISFANRATKPAGEAPAKNSVVWKLDVESMVKATRRNPIQRTDPSKAQLFGLPQIIRFSGQQTKKKARTATATAAARIGA